MLQTESLAEYYHLVHLVNGSVLDIPSGRSGFLPAPEPLSHDMAIFQPASTWPQTIQLSNDRSDGISLAKLKRVGMGPPACVSRVKAQGVYLTR
jgi:hypothetical protein